MHRAFILLTLLATTLTLGPGAARAQTSEDLPLWELGIGVIGRYDPEYPGSSEYRGGSAAFPFFTYRGRVFEFGGDTIARIIPFSTERLQLGVTIDAAPSLQSQENRLREGLPDLDSLFEIGPEVNIRFAETPAIFGSGGAARAELSLQARGVFSFGDGTDHVGNLFRPALRYRQDDALKPGSRFTASIGPIFASEGVHAFFYDVQDGGSLTPFEADGGYFGTEIDAAIRYPITDRANLVAGVGVTLLSEAANRDSPLFEDEVNATVFLGLTYSLFRSERRAGSRR